MGEARRLEGEGVLVGWVSLLARIRNAPARQQRDVVLCAEACRRRVVVDPIRRSLLYAGITIDTRGEVVSSHVDETMYDSSESFTSVHSRRAARQSSAGGAV